jgi:hypothetical protein
LFWIIKRRFKTLPEKTDLMFDFCNGLELKELLILKSFFMKLKINSDNIFAEMDLLKIFAYENNYLGDSKIRSIFLKNFIDQYFKVKEFLNNNKNIDLKNNTIVISKKKKFHNKKKGISSKKAQKVLIDINHLFKINNIEWFPISGTFLGFVREKSFLGHDLDIDIGLFSNDCCFEKLKNILKINNTFKISKIEYQKCFFDNKNYLNRPTFVRILHKNGINIDLYFHFIIKNYIYHGTSSILWKNTLFDLRKYTIYGMKIKGPANSNLYLTETYGDWKKEKLNYDFHRDMLSLDGALNYLGLEYLLRRKLYCGRESNGNLSALEELLL